MRIAGIYLAAGQSRRMGQPKLSLALAPGKPLGSLALQAMRDSGVLNTLAVVVRPDDSLDWLGDRRDFDIVPCGNAEQGLSYSLRCGMRQALRTSPDAVLLALADQPFVSSRLFQDIAEAGVKNEAFDFVATDYGTYTAPPVLLRRSMFTALEKLDGDRGAQRLLAGDEWRGIAIQAGGPDTGMDVDTPEEWEHASHCWRLKFGNKV